MKKQTTQSTNTPNFKVKSWNNYKVSSTSFEKPNEMEDMTVQDDAISVRQLLEMHVKGLPIPPGKNEVYYDDEDFIDETLEPDFDLVDAQRIDAELKENRKPKPDTGLTPDGKGEPAKGSSEAEAPGGVDSPSEV